MVIYNYRREVLEGENKIYELVRDLIVRTIEDLFGLYFPTRAVTREGVDALYKELSRVTGLDSKLFEEAGFDRSNSDVFQKDVINFCLEKYALYRGQQNEEMIRDAEKWLVLETVDQTWKQHMINIDHLKEGIGLRGWGQKNPLIEYKREAFAMFQDMMQYIRRDIVGHIFHLNLDLFNKQELEARREKELEALKMLSSDTTGAVHQQKAPGEAHIGRNDPCPCGSGKKYKKCCGVNK
jgi:preprotein translocase subunit SecA